MTLSLGKFDTFVYVCVRSVRVRTGCCFVLVSLKMAAVESAHASENHLRLLFKFRILFKFGPYFVKGKEFGLFSEGCLVSR